MTFEDLYAAATTGPDPAYAYKQLHAIPEAPVYDRVEFVLKETAGEVVLDIGASGPLHTMIANVSQACYGWDLEGGPGVTGIDLDDVSVVLPVYSDVTRVICGEVLEHLSNPGHFLFRLRQAYPCRTIITVPNAHSASGLRWATQGIDNVNRDHVAWHSPRTITTLLERAAYAIRQWGWYNGRPGTAEGLIVVAEPG